VGQNHRELINWTRGATFDADGSGETNPAESIRNITQSTGGAVHCLQLRGEYLYVAEGEAGFEAYDVASVGNKDISDKIITAPFSPLGHDTRLSTKNATCLALPTNQSIAPLRNTPEMRAQNQEQPFHPIYHYAFITDSEEGLIVVNIDSLTDREPRNNFFSRALTWNEGGILKGARHITMGSHFAYIAADVGLVVLNLDDPLKPQVASVVKLPDARASALQFRYLFVTDARGLEVLDVTKLDQPRLVQSATVKLADARRVYVARTYAYVAAKQEGLVIVNVEKPEHPFIDRRVTLGGQLNDAEDVIVGSTNASLFAYVADGRNGFKVLQLTSPATQPNFYGFSPKPVPELIAWAHTRTPALALSKGLDRDRAVDETGHQIAVTGRLGSRPFTRAEMEKFFVDSQGDFYRVTDTASLNGFVPKGGATDAISKKVATPRSRSGAMH
jgi:hypothetical protein